MKREWGTRRARLRGPALLGPVVLLLGLVLAMSPDPLAPAASARPATPVAARSVPGTAPYKAVTHNVQRKRQAVDAAIAQAKSYGARVVFLQELCLDDFRALQRDYGDVWTLSFQAKGVHSGGGVRFCHNEEDPDEVLPDGVATVWTGGPGGTSRQFVFDAQDPANQDDTAGLACVFYGGGKVRLCTTHTVRANPTARRAEHREIRDLTRPWVGRGKLVVLAGDFNARPTSHDMDPIYTGAGSDGGRFREVSRSGGRDCRCGVGTVGGDAEDASKFDYLFYSASAAPEATRRTAYALPATFTESDHRMLRGYADVRFP